MSSISIIEYAIRYPKKLDNETQLLKKDTIYMSLRTWRYFISADFGASPTSIDSVGKRCAWYKRGLVSCELHKLQ